VIFPLQLCGNCFFKSGIPPTGVYLVLFSFIDFIAACFTFSGVLKSGSPARNDNVFAFAFQLLCFCVNANVALGAMFLAL